MFFKNPTHFSKSVITLAAALALLITAASGRAEEAKKEVPKADPYTLPICIISGHALDSMGEPVSHTHEGREVKFCCGECTGEFKKNPAEHLKKIDAEIIKAQKPNYPTELCVVSGHKLGEMGEPVDYVVGNRYVQLCCKDCIPALKKDPSKAMAKLDEAEIAKQKANYPLDTCVVSGKKLGSMGEPIDKLVNGRLVRLCCNGCVKPLEKDPAKYISKIDEAAKAKAEKK